MTEDRLTMKTCHTTLMQQLKLERQTTPELIANTLRDAIMKGDLIPGTPLRETKLKSSLGVSRPVIREAFRLLTQDGLLTYNAYQGVSVSTLDQTDVREIYTLRLMVEPFSVEYHQPSILKEQLSILKETSETFAKAIKKKDLVAMFDADLAFHTILVKLAGVSRLEDFFQITIREWRLAHGLYPKGMMDFSEGIREHNAIVNALERKNVSSAVKHLVKHLTRSRDYLLGLMEQEVSTAK
jgi:DNA-binding GntR family transcriptional regulator